MDSLKKVRAVRKVGEVKRKVSKNQNELEKLEEKSEEKPEQRQKSWKSSWKSQKSWKVRREVLGMGESCILVDCYKCTLLSTLKPLANVYASCVFS